MNSRLDVWWLDGRLYLADACGTAPPPLPAPPPANALPAAAQAVLDADPLLSRAQAAAWLGVATGTLAEWASNGKGPDLYDYGREVRYPLNALLRWREAQLRRLAPPEPPAPAAPLKRPRGRPPKAVSRGGRAPAREGRARRAPAATRKPPLQSTPRKTSPTQNKTKKRLYNKPNSQTEPKK